MRTLGATLVRAGSPILEDAPLVAVRWRARRVRGRRVVSGETRRGDRRSPAVHFADPALEPAMHPAPTACDILGLVECTKAAPSREESAPERAVRLLISAKPVPESRLDAFPSSLLAGSPCAAVLADDPQRMRFEPRDMARPVVELEGRQPLRGHAELADQRFVHDHCRGPGAPPSRPAASR